MKAARYLEVWRAARRRALTPAEAASPLARRPYDLRHAAVSRWLNAGVSPTQVAEWAGHSVRVLLTVYAKCIVGEEQRALRPIDASFASEEPADPAPSAVVPASGRGLADHDPVHALSTDSRILPETTGQHRTPPGAISGPTEGLSVTKWGL